MKADELEFLCDGEEWVETNREALTAILCADCPVKPEAGRPIWKTCGDMDITQEGCYKAWAVNELIEIMDTAEDQIKKVLRHAKLR